MSEDRSIDNWLDHPDVDAVVPYFDEIVGESDRGAALITAEIINSSLEKSIVACLPKFLTGRKKQKEILDFTGPLGTFSSRIKFAAIQGWIGEITYNAVEALRELRNDAAHVDAGFNLGSPKNRGLITRFLETGDGVAIQIHNINTNLLLSEYLEKIKLRGQEIEKEIGRNPFETNRMISEELTKRPDWSKPFEQKIAKLNLAVGAYLFVGLLTVGTSKRDASRL